MRRSIVALMCFLAAGAQAEAGDYRYSTIDLPDSILTEALGINAQGTIVGRAVDAEHVSHAFRLQDGEFALIEVPGAAVTLAARGINGHGEIVGNFHDNLGVRHGFLLSNGAFTQIDFPGAVDTVVEEITDAGEITGMWVDVGGNVRGFMLKDEQFSDVSVAGAEQVHVLAAQDGGQVLVGKAEIGGQTFGFIRRQPNDLELLAFSGSPLACSSLRYINKRGDIVGGYAILGAG